MARGNAATRKLSEQLRAFALGLPGAYEDFPWGELVMKVNKKVFIFLGKPDSGEAGFGMSVKLPNSNVIALGLPFTEPTGYGLGKSGWITVKLPPGELPPAEMMKEWILESYRAVAPQKLSAQLDGASRGGAKAVSGAPPAPAKGAAKPAASRRSAKRSRSSRDPA